MTTLPARRSRTLRAAPHTRTEKKFPNLRSPVDIRRQRALARYWDDQKAAGRSLKLTRVAHYGGYKDANYVRQCLRGHAPLNAHVMLSFATELAVAPQRIWEADWLFPLMTPDFNAMQHIFQRWQDLDPASQLAIQSVLSTVLVLLDRKKHPSDD